MNDKEVKLRLAGTFASINDGNNNTFRYDLDELSVGINYKDKHIIKLSANRGVDWVISRVCDHASGTLQPCSESDIAECPLHGWKLDLNSLNYINVNVSKHKLAFEHSDNYILIKQPITHLQLPDSIAHKQNTADLEIRFLAHACLLFTCDKINIITDPWITGPCFLNGWWHEPTPCNDALDQLLNANIVYISHNHPDHMHEESLIKLYEYRPNIPIVIPNFKSKSAERSIRNIGFNNIIPLAFNQIYQLTPYDIYISILKSGDFRDDSGLYISYGQKQSLITVDSSSLNHYILPSDIDFLATSFAAGASGHPWCFDHYSEEEKRHITSNRHLSVKNSILKYIDTCKPRSYMPYAGYFSEAAPRDSYIKKNNLKNSCNEITKLINASYPQVTSIDPITTDKITISDTIQANKSNIDRQAKVPSTTIDKYLHAEESPDLDDFMDIATEYFSTSKFNDNLILYLQPCDSEFIAYKKGLMINFSNNENISIQAEQLLLTEYNVESSTQRKLFIKVRMSALWQVIKNHKSWEELSIGFHCRIHRKPDVYNSDFWYHFSNIYIK